MTGSRVGPPSAGSGRLAGTGGSAGSVGLALVAALAVEARKALASRVMWTATALLVVGIATLTATLVLAAEAGNEQVLSQLGPLAELEGWARLIGAATQISSAAVLLGFGVVLSWMLGREFADGTVSGLFALPVGRGTVAAAKLLVFWLWSVLVGVALVVAVALLGYAVGSGPLDGSAAAGLGGSAAAALARLLVLVILSGLLAVPAGWVATLGRGLLPGIATAIVLVIIAQVAVIAGSGAWFPVAAPALWAIEPAAVSIGQLALVPSVPLVFGALTVRAWGRLELDR